MSISLANSAVAVTLSIGSWGGQKLDRIATDKVNTDSQASSDASKVTKNLVAGSVALKNIKKYESKVRARSIYLTSPWGESERICPTSSLMDHKHEIGTLCKHIWDGMRDKFLITDYPDIKRNAYMNLGSMYDPTDYPTVEEIADKFYFRLIYKPLASDWRIDLPAQQVEELKLELENEYQNRTQNLVQEQCDRVGDLVRSMTNKLGIEVDDEGKDKDGRKTRWYDSFITNATDLCDLLVHLNVTKDPKIDQMRLDLRNAVEGVSVDTLKLPTNHNTRADMKGKLDNILAKYAL